MRRSIPLLAVLLAFAAAAPASAADKVVAPPGNSGVTEYLEVVPGAGGDTPASGGGTSSTQSTKAALGASNAAALDKLGSDGKKAAELAAATAPTSQKVARERSKGNVLGATEKQGTSIAANGGGRVGTIATALSGQGGGFGLLFPLLLGGAVLAVIALVAARRFARR